MGQTSGSNRRHYPFYFAVLAGLLGLAIASWLLPRLAVQVGANAFFLVYLVLSAVHTPRLTAAFLKQHAAGADEPVWVIFAVTFSAVATAVGSLFMLINASGPHSLVAFSLALASVTLGWLTIHTMTALHYAHRFWRPDGDGPGKSGPHGGLEFPGSKQPCGYDFLYFAFVVGMTAQTSDVAVTNTAMRKLTLLHGVVSFFFNTVLVAAAVNLAVSLGQ